MNQTIGLLNKVMRCAGVAMVRNEADMIEVWARYNLRVIL